MMGTTMLEAGRPGARHKYALVKKPPFWLIEERESGKLSRSFPVSDSEAGTVLALPAEKTADALWRLYHINRLEAKPYAPSWAGGQDDRAS